MAPFLTEWRDDRPIKVLLLPREHLKSTFASEILPSYVWCQDDPGGVTYPSGRDTRFLLAHGKREMACDYVSSTRSMHESRDELRELWPDLIWENPDSKRSRMEQAPHWGAKAPRWQSDRLDVVRSRWERTPSMMASGTNASVTGFHFDWLIFDDLVYAENVGTAEMREKTLTYFKQCMALLRKGGRVLVIGTRWHWDDMYGTLIDPEGPYAGMVESLVLQSGYQTGEPIYPVNDRVPKCGFDMERLELKRQSMGDYEFWCQYENHPRREGSASFHESQILRYEYTIDGQFPTSEERNYAYFTAVDPNHTTNSANDYGVVATIAVDSAGHVWVVDLWRGHPTIKGLIDQMFDHVERWGSAAVAWESVGFQSQAEAEIREQMEQRDQWFTLVPMKRGPLITKHNRCLKLQPIVEAGMFHVKRGELGDELIKEMVNLRQWKNDDLIDAVTDAFTVSRKPFEREIQAEAIVQQPNMMCSIISELHAAGLPGQRQGGHYRRK